MPKVTRQAAVPPPGRTARASRNGSGGSLLSRAVPVAELTDDWIKMVIYGQNRVGKTTLACQFPKPLLLVSFEPSRTGGARSVRRVPGVSLLRIESTEQAEALAGELANDRTYTSHVLDGVSNWERMHLADVLGIGPDELTEQVGRSAHGGISRDQYTDRTERLKNQLKKFLRLPAHTVVLCREKDHSPPADQYRPRMMRGTEPESFLASDLSGGACGWLHDACDYVCRLYVDREVKQEVRRVKVNGKVKERTVEVETGRMVRRLRTAYHVNFAGGFRSEYPETLPEYIQEPTFAKVEALIRGGGVARGGKAK